MRGDVFLADLIEALHALDVRDARHASRLAQMLGVESLPELQEPTELPLPAARSKDLRPSSSQPLPIGPAPDPNAPTPLPAAQHGAAHAVLVEAEPATSAPAAPLWLTTIQAMARAAPTLRPTRLLIDPLFEPPRQRALLGALAAAPISDGEVDVDVLIEQLARRQMPRELPRHRGWSLRRGVQILLDRGPAMVPFDHDVDALLRHLHGLMPVDRIACVHFAGSPLHGCRLPGGPARQAWTPPPRGTPVLLVSDLGIGGAAQQLGRSIPSAWRDFAAAAAEAGVLLRTLVPYAPVRWPPGLGLRLRALHWDRRTTTAAVRRLLGA